MINIQVEKKVSVAQFMRKTLWNKIAECEINTIVTFVEIKDSEPDFLKYLDQIGLQMGHQIEIKDRIDFDNSLRIQFDGHKIFISHIVANNIYVTKN